MKAASAPDEVLGGEYNLGTGEDISIGELAEMVIDQIGRPIVIETDTARLRPDKSEVMRLLSDNNLAREQLGWQPRYTLNEGIEETIAWIADHIDFYRVGQYEI